MLGSLVGEVGGGGEEQRRGRTTGNSLETYRDLETGREGNRPGIPRGRPDLQLQRGTGRRGRAGILGGVARFPLKSLWG